MRFIILMALLMNTIYAETKFATPKPSFDNPRRVIFPIIHADDESINHVLSTANNLMKFYGPDNIKIKIVAYYHGIKAVTKVNKAIVARVKSLQEYDVEFYACHNTMKTKKIKVKELLSDVQIITAGVAEIIERTQEGWTYIKP